MAKDTKQPVQPSHKKKVEYSTLRLYADDARNIVELAALRGTTVAELYGEMFGKNVRDALISEAEQRLKSLKNQTN